MSFLFDGDDEPSPLRQELRDGATLIVRSRAAALRGAQVARAVKGGKGPSKGSQARLGCRY